MKVIKTYFDQNGYEEELLEEFSEIKKVEYLYLNAVVDTDGRPLLIVYNKEEGVKTIFAYNCKIIE